MCIGCKGSAVMMPQCSPCWAGHSNPAENDAPAQLLPSKVDVFALQGNFFLVPISWWVIYDLWH